MREAALAVVGQDDEIGVRQQAIVIGEFRRENLVRRRGLEIDAQQLLLAADHAQLDGRRQRRIAMERRRHVFAGEHARERRTRLIVADDGQQRRPRAQRRRVARDVGGAAGRSSVRAILTTGTGASGEMRSTSPNQ